MVVLGICVIAILALACSARLQKLACRHRDRYQRDSYRETKVPRDSVKNVNVMF